MIAHVIAPNLVEVRLSRRNLEDLVKMLDDKVPTERCWLQRRGENGVLLYVVPEEDAEHYAERATPAGPGYRAHEQDGQDKVVA